MISYLLYDVIYHVTCDIIGHMLMIYNWIGFTAQYQPTRQVVSLQDSGLFASNTLGVEDGSNVGRSKPTGKSGVVGSRNVEMTDAHRQGLQMLKERDLLIVSISRTSL
jgi:hypothetical protein